jgi:heme/copper-type cytochrome/quinol oxidase subunit 4
MAEPSRRAIEVRRASVRVFLGFLQMTGAMTTFLILIQLGDHRLTYLAALATFIVTAIIMLLFRKREY